MNASRLLYVTLPGGMAETALTESDVPAKSCVSTERALPALKAPMRSAYREASHAPSLGFRHHISGVHVTVARLARNVISAALNMVTYVCFVRVVVQS
ncbi:hypothetical protein CHU98_g286 [Xylaria longipes]|nr:hypothetical protein CHU98_g286 [Xylaria longipes]